MFVPKTAAPRNRQKWAVARAQRLSGRPYKRIAADLGVSPSTVYLWTSDIELTPEQIERNRTGPGGPWNPREVAKRAYSWRKRCRNRRLLAQRAGRARTLEGDPLHLAGCMLYWAEGSKARNTLQFANSELAMLALFKHFLVECFEVGPDRFTVSLNVYLNNGLTIDEVERYWLDGLELPRECCRKHILNHTPTSSSGLRKHKLPYGVCSLTVLRSTEIVQHIHGAIQEYGGFDEARWLDGPPRRG